MPKAGEIDYLDSLDPAGREHVRNKPFSDPNCSQYLLDMGALMAVMPPPPARLLDLGVGGGWTSIFFARRGYDVVGQDIAPAMVAMANEVGTQQGIAKLRFVAGDYEALDFREEFDCAVFYDSLHHSEDECAALRSAYAALKPGGVCVALEPGVGHASQEASRSAAETYGVTERDMPPSLIMRAGQAAGFGRMEIHRRPSLAAAGTLGSLFFFCREIAKILIGRGNRQSGLVVMHKE
ncbi:MAG: class I SAM-dependent methyltransferase [Deltaproteobacteria bacterium]|nr:class I SAM-dependent methyltransferase [Deltaproteobacteria bacterium]